MALRNAFENLGLDSTLQAIRDRLPSALGGNGGVKVEQQGSLPSGTNVIGAVKIADSVGADEATVTPSGALKVDLSATAGNTTAVKVDGSAVTQPVSGTVTSNQGGVWDVRNVSGTVALPTGAATSANQATANTSLSSIDTKTPALGQALASASVPVILPSATIATLTPPANPNPATSTKQSDGSQKTQVVDGSGNVISSTSNALDVNLKSGTTGLALDATLTGGNQQTKITNGTTVADTVAGDSGNNALVITGGRKEVSFSTTSAQAVASTDVSNYRWVSVQINSQGGSSTVSFQYSNDNNTWSSMSLSSASIGSNAYTASTTSVQTLSGPLYGRYFRLNVTGIASGTTAGIVEFLTIAPPIHTVGLTQVGTAAALADAITNPTIGNIASYGSVYNGSTWDRWRGQVTNDTASLYSGLTKLTPTFATITANTTGATTIVAAVASKKILVLQYVLVATSAVNVKFQSHVTPTDLTGLLYLGANTGVSSPYSPVGLFQTVSGEALDINLSGNIAVGGHLVYVTV
jgi:hypothetical protein